MSLNVPLAAPATRSPARWRGSTPFCSKSWTRPGSIASSPGSASGLSAWWPTFRAVQVLAALLDAMDPGCAASMVEVQMAEGQGSRLSDPAHIVVATKEMLAEEAARLGKK